MQIALLKKSQKTEHPIGMRADQIILGKQRNVTRDKNTQVHVTYCLTYILIINMVRRPGSEVRSIRGQECRQKLKTKRTLEC